MRLEEYFRALSLDDIDAFMVDAREEDLHLDFILVNDPCLNKHDRRMFAKAVSGFANSDGGLIVGGIDARNNADGADCAQAKTWYFSSQAICSEAERVYRFCGQPDRERRRT
jgi:hypothetical protein